MLVRPPGEDLVGVTFQGLKTLATIVCPPGKDRKGTSWLQLARLSIGKAGATGVNDKEKRFPSPKRRFTNLCGMHPGECVILCFSCDAQVGLLS